MRFYRRGRHVEQFEVSEWFGLRRRKAEIEVFDDIVLLVAMKTQAEIGSQRELRVLKRRKIVPGSVLLKYFRNIACGDLYALFPNARVVMSNFDKAFLGVPAIAGGIPILIKLYATISVLFLVVGIYLGGSTSVADADMKAALAALMGIVALGGFAMRQWLKYQHQSLKYHMELAENIYYRNINNNAGIFDYSSARPRTRKSRRRCSPIISSARRRRRRRRPSLPRASRRGSPKTSELTLISRSTMRWRRSTVSACCGAKGSGSLSHRSTRAIAQLHRVWDEFFQERTGGRVPIALRPARRSAQCSSSMIENGPRPLGGLSAAGRPLAHCISLP